MKPKYIIWCLLGLLLAAGGALGQPVDSDTIIITGTVIDASDSTALEGVMVKVVQTQGPLSTVIDSALTNAQGQYTMNDVEIPFGLVSVNASLAGYVSGTQEVLFPRPDTLTADFALEAETVTGDTTLVSGTVTDAISTDPIADATVIAVVGFGGGLRDTIGTAVTQANGTYQMTLVTNRTQGSFTASAAGYNDQTDNQVALDSAITVDFALTAVVVTGDTTLVSGTVTDSTTGDPITDATVIAVVRTGGGPGGGQLDTIGTAVTQANGTYQMTLVTERGNADFIASAAGYDDRTFTNVVLDPDITVDFNLWAPNYIKDSGPMVTLSGRLDIAPNPSSAVMRIRVPVNGVISIYNFSGQLVRTFSGSDVTWDGTNAHGSKVEAGTYLVKTMVEGEVFCRKVILTK